MYVIVHINSTSQQNKKSLSTFTQCIFILILTFYHNKHISFQIISDSISLHFIFHIIYSLTDNRNYQNGIRKEIIKMRREIQIGNFNENQSK